MSTTYISPCMNTYTTYSFFSCAKTEWAPSYQSLPSTTNFSCITPTIWPLLSCAPLFIAGGCEFSGLWRWKSESLHTACKDNQWRYINTKWSTHISNTSHWKHVFIRTIILLTQTFQPYLKVKKKKIHTKRVRYKSVITKRI